VGGGDRDGVFFLLPWVFISDPGSDVAGEDVPLIESNCDKLEDEDAPAEDKSEGEDSGKKLLRILTTSLGGVGHCFAWHVRVPSALIGTCVQ